MTQQTQESPQETQETTKALLPTEYIEPPEEPTKQPATGIRKPDLKPSDDLVQNIAAFQNLTERQLVVLAALADNAMSGHYYTDTQIGANLGIHRNTIRACRRNVNFALALSVIIREVVRGHTDKLIETIYRHADKDWKAAELLLKYTGEYVPSSQVLNIQARTPDTTEYSSERDAVDDFLIYLGGLGYSARRITERFEKLRSEGAF